MPEFFATGMQGEDIVYSKLGGLVRGRLLITGFHGDKLWNPWIAPNAVFKRGDISGSSLGEFRLLRDFIHLPLPFAGAQRHGDLARIGRSAEMRSYSVGGPYDRPIPRRIAEQAGVPRAAFGQLKKAISFPIFSEKELIPPDTRRAIETFCGPTLAGQAIYHVRSTWFRFGIKSYNANIRGLRFLPPAARPLYQVLWKAILRLVFGAWETFEHTDPFMALTFLWAIDKMVVRYFVRRSGR
jgi:hypothetical protein